MLKDEALISTKISLRNNSEKMLLDLVNIGFAYNVGAQNELQIFSNLNESFMRGEFISLLGPSGCGKTTLLDIIAGIYKPTSGELNWHSKTIHVGYLFQEYPFLPQTTVFKHVAFPLLMAGRDNSFVQSEVNSWLEKVGLLDYASYLIKSLSVGMKARVALATVLIASPHILLLDEPFRALDLETRVQMWNHLKNVTIAQHCTTLLVTHDLNEAIALSDRVMTLSRTPTRIIAREPILFDTKLTPMQRLETFESGELHQRLWSALREAFMIDAA